MRTIKRFLFWLISPGVPGFVPVFVAVGLGVVIISQTTTIRKRNEQIAAEQAQKAVLKDSLLRCETQIANTKKYYHESVQKYQTQLAEIQATVLHTPASLLPAAIADDLRAIDSLLRSRPDGLNHAGPGIPGHAGGKDAAGGAR